jgi:hypothetical protein
MVRQAEWRARRARTGPAGGPKVQLGGVKNGGMGYTEPNQALLATQAESRKGAGAMLYANSSRLPPGVPARARDTMAIGSAARGAVNAAAPVLLSVAGQSRPAVTAAAR